MEQAVVLEPFDRILSGYEKLTEVSVTISDCSYLCERYKKFGVQGYRLGDYRGMSYLNRYLTCSVKRAPMLIYKDKYLIPLVFRMSEDSYRLFDEPVRMEAFFYLLDWYLENKPKKIIMKTPREDGIYVNNPRNLVIDSAYLSFRLSEILDGSGFPLSQISDLEEFIDWNRVNKLIDNGGIGRHSKIFDCENQQNMSELRVIFKIIHLKYPETQLLEF